ncbi:MAG: 16S rRNA (uracil(1498)-N(3))-methyltransferase [Verrucomicrobiales bacterium]|nr:16S rRNA (uracil(1498)-N(3))-methyltransferase [Verrucomicrobiales bacterium]
MSQHRFYLAADHWNPEALVLEASEARHCAEVLRCKEGERITLFNGEGTEAITQIQSLQSGGRQIELKLIALNKTPRPPAFLHLGQAIPKGKNMDLIVQKATELGASRITPLLSERTIVRLDSAEAEKKRAKWQKVALEACKQCGQNWLPEIAPIQSVENFLSSHPAGNSPDQLPLIAALHSDAQSLKDLLSAHSPTSDQRPSQATILIGPEGDFTPAELSTAISAGYRPLSLGPIILRSETAAIYALSVLAHELMR